MLKSTSKLRRKLLTLVFLLGCLVYQGSATPAAASSGCGEPFVITVTDCWPSWWLPISCTETQYACVMCDGGASPCFQLFN